MTLSWTTEQEAVFAAVGTGHVLVRARAGSAKTTTLVEAERRLRASRAADTILMLAFNSKIKEELAKKVSSNTTVLTMNGLGHRAWARFINRRLILNTSKVGEIVTELVKDADMREAWVEVRALCSAAKVAGIVPVGTQGGKGLIEDTNSNWEEVAEALDLDYSTSTINIARQALRVSISQAFGGTIDFDDQLYMSVCFGGNFSRYDHVFVDETQDLSPIQHIMVERSLGLRGNLLAVGDDRQAIYAFRGAATNSMDLLAAKFKPKELKLTTCFRCAQLIVKHAQEIVPDIRPFNPLPAGEIKFLETWDPQLFQQGDAILCRNNAPLISVAMKLIRANVPCYMIGRDLSRGLISLLSKLSNKNDYMDLKQVMQKLDAWESLEIRNAQAKRDRSREDKAADKAASLRVLAEGCSNLESLKVRINQLFSRTTGKVTLSTGHRSKGLEFPRVYILDDFLIGDADQELNLRYIMRTRAKLILNYIESEQFTGDIS